MRVLFISSGDDKYGAPKSLFDLMIALKKGHGVTPVLLTKKRNILNDLCDKEGIENHSFWYRDIMAGAPYRNPLMRILKHLVKYFLFCCGALTARNIGRVGIDFSTIDIIHTNLNRLDIGMVIRKKYQLPHIVHLREYKTNNIVFYKRGLINYLNQGTDYFIAISNGVLENWRSQKLTEDKTVLIYNGIAVNETFTPDKVSDGSKLKMIIIGRIEPIKGQLELIKALGHLEKDIRDKIELDIAGEAYHEYKAVLKKEIHALGLDGQVNFLGYVSNIFATLSDYDVGIVCSLSEGFGRVTVECMMAGLAVIASDTGANPEIINDKINGRIYRYGDTLHLALIISELFNDRNELKKLANAGKAKALTAFSSASCADKVYKLYERLLGNT
ncbi:MAG: glycosyltransferase family 4 protein [Lachnospiraceae bacterium]|nr:glycosyltransferase family 4 protein [Lachnospiraceae bacterium]